MPSRRWVRDDWKQGEGLCGESWEEQEQAWRDFGNVDRNGHRSCCCSEMTMGQNQCQYRSREHTGGWIIICDFSSSACIPRLSTYSRSFHALSPLIGIDVHILESKCGSHPTVGLLTSSRRRYQTLWIGRLAMIMYLPLARWVLRLGSRSPKGHRHNDLVSAGDEGANVPWVWLAWEA